jgi:hypothetical protein
MPRSCTVCRHPDRPSIDVALTSGEALRSIGRRYDLTHRALARHKQGHMSGSDRERHVTETREKKAETDEVVNRVLDLVHKTRELLARAEHAGEWGSALLSIREARATAELEAELLARISSRVRERVLMLQPEPETDPQLDQDKDNGLDLAGAPPPL